MSLFLFEFVLASLRIILFFFYVPFVIVSRVEAEIKFTWGSVAILGFNLVVVLSVLDEKFYKIFLCGFCAK